MNTTFNGNTLIRELLADPSAFEQRGRAYQLLKEYFEGLPVDTLRPLLSHEDTLVKRAAVWVASELGHQACMVLDDVIPLVDSGDRFIYYHVLEVAVVCAIGDNVDRFICIPEALDSGDDIIRGLAMRLLARADRTQLNSALRIVVNTASASDAHKRGLSLLATCESRDPDDVRRLLLDDAPVARMYGAIAAKRIHSKVPDLLQLAARLPDPTIRRFAEQAG